jgi:hypothetical protein
MNHLAKDLKLCSIGALVVLGTWVPAAFAATSGGVAVSTTVVSGSSTTSTSSTSSISSSDANVKLSQEEVLSIARGLFPDDFSTLGTPTVNLQPMYGGDSTQVYHVGWSPKMNRPSGPDLNNSYTNITIDANTGQLLQYQNNVSQWVHSDLVISTGDAEKIAEALLKKLAPNQAGELKLQANSGTADSGFVYQFMREINGIVAPFDAAKINLDRSGKLISYQFSWHDATFPAAPTARKSQAEATTLYNQNLNLILQYQTIYGPNGRGPLQLVYQPQGQDTSSPYDESTPVLDAVTGQLLGMDGKPLTTGSTVDLSPLVAGGPADFPILETKPISQASLEAQVANQFGLTGDDWKMTDAEQQTDLGSGSQVPNHPVLNLNYSNQKTHGYVGVQVDMLDGVIVGYNLPSISSGSILNSQVDAHMIGDAFVKKLFPNLTGAIARAPLPKVIGQPDNQTSVSYDFLVGGVPVNGFTINVDTSTGTVMNYWLMQDPSAEFPSAKNALSADAAKTVFLKRDPVELQYVLPETTNTNSNTPFPVQYGTSAQLVYGATPLPDGPELLDALTGNWIALLPNGLVHTVPAESKGETNAEQAIRLLEQNGVVSGDEAKVDLAAPMSHAEFIAWLSRAYQYNISGSPTPQFPDVSADNPYAGLISLALMQGWLPNKGNLNPDAALTRDEAASWLVEWMNWQGPASHIQFFKIPFSDVSDVPESDQGAAAMMSAAGILPLESGKFNPNQKLTVGDAAIAMVKAIDVLLGSN